MFCGKCGKELPEGTTVCESCASSNASASSEAFDLPVQPSLCVDPIQVSPDSVQKTNSMAIASLIVSIVGLFMGLGIVAVILGIIGQNQIRASMGRQKGSGLAIAGIVIGCLGIVVLVIQIFMGVYLIPIINDLEH